MNAAVKALYLVLEAVDPADVPNGCLFIDATNGNTLSQKTINGVIGAIASSANSNPFMRQFVAGEAFPAKKPLALRQDGKIVMADSDGAQRTNLIGHSSQASLGEGSVVSVLCIGTYLAGVLSGLGFNSGDSIFIGETAGQYTNNVSAFTGTNDTYIKCGIALPPAGESGTAATDLLVITQLLGSD